MILQLLLGLWPLLLILGLGIFVVLFITGHHDSTDCPVCQNEDRTLR